MKGISSAAVEVLRGLAVDPVPLRLGRAKASVAAPDAGKDEAARQEQALREAHARAVHERREEGLRCGRAEGLREGLREGRAQAAEEIRQAVQRARAEAESQRAREHERLSQLVGHAEEALADLLGSAQDELVALCYETVCRMLGAAGVQPEAVRSQVTQLLEQHGAREVTLHLHPQDVPLLESLGAACIPDPAVAVGGCILRSPGGALDARLDTMLAACKEALLQARAQRGRAPVAGGAA